MVAFEFATILIFAGVGIVGVVGAVVVVAIVAADALLVFNCGLVCVVLELSCIFVGADALAVVFAFVVVVFVVDLALFLLFLIRFSAASRSFASKYHTVMA